MLFSVYLWTAQYADLIKTLLCGEGDKSGENDNVLLINFKVLLDAFLFADELWKQK